MRRSAISVRNARTVLSATISKTLSKSDSLPRFAILGPGKCGESGTVGVRFLPSREVVAELRVFSRAAHGEEG